MPVAVACLVPSAPLLLPRLTGDRVPETARVRAAVATALGDLVGLERVAVVAPRVPGTLAGFGARHQVSKGKADRGPARPSRGGTGGAGPGPALAATSWPHALAAELLASVAGTPAVEHWCAWDELTGADGDEGAGADPDGIAGSVLLEALDAAPGRTGLLLLADGSRTRGSRAPGGDDPRGTVVDAELAAALLAGRPAVVADAAAVGATAAPAVALLARLVGGGPHHAAGTVELLLAQAPLGVGYLVATVRRGGRPVTPPEAAQVVAVVGATATGKSDLAVDLALELGGEVVNADSMQLYAGMDVGTAKITPEERRGVPHHLLDVWPVTRAAAVAEYQQMSRSAFEAARRRGHVPLLVGGSGLYVRAALDDLRFPGTDPAVRARWEAVAARDGAVAVHEQLHEVDPAAAARILPSNTRRVVRALEVVELTGRPFAAAMPVPGEASRVVPALVVGLRRPREELDRRVEARVDRMWQDGLVAEVEHLLGLGLEEGPTASRAVGYAQVLDLLRGRCTQEEARARTVAATRRLVRRQESWFGADPDVVWLDAGEPGTLGRLVDLARSRLAR